MRRLLTRAAIVLCLVVSGCGDDDDATVSVPSSVASTTTLAETTTTDASTTTLAPESSTTSTTAPAAVVTIGAVSLQPDGLGGVGDFGTDGDALLLEVAAAFNGTAFGGVEGSPDDDSGWMVDTNDVSPCNGQEIRSVRWGDLTVVLADSDAPVFQGWVMRGPGASTGLTTPEGVALGATDAEVRAIHGDDAFGDSGIYAQIFVTSMENPTIRGIMSEEGAGGVVDSLDAGTACLGIAT